jgi:hypothetical protein
MKMAEACVPPASSKSPDAIVIADGTSCRHQIADGTGRAAWHVARLLEAALSHSPASPRESDLASTPRQ